MFITQSLSENKYYLGQYSIWYFINLNCSQWKLQDCQPEEYVSIHTGMKFDAKMLWFWFSAFHWCANWNQRIKSKVEQYKIDEKSEIIWTIWIIYLIITLVNKPIVKPLFHSCIPKYGLHSCIPCFWSLHELLWSEAISNKFSKEGNIMLHLLQIDFVKKNTMGISLHYCREFSICEYFFFFFFKHWHNFTRNNKSKCLRQKYQGWLSISRNGTLEAFWNYKLLVNQNLLCYSQRPNK